ncbi:MAG: 3-dehydroquinate synthase [Bacteroidota bacterium]|nr:3-dehydroquinate synthase [Bacteroidota bacterium]
MNEENPPLANIFIGVDSLNKMGQYIPASSSVFVLVDENTLKYCYPLLSSTLAEHSLIQIPSGEENKSLNQCEIIWQKLTEANADRSSLLINLGGGVIGDLGGFAAGCYKRGIKFVNVPTTLLAMVDASVGAKTGVDFMGYKNQVGLFNEPEGVFIYPDFLKTLSERELTSGFAEVIKHYLIADKAAFEQIQNSKPEIRDLNFAELVERNVHIKSSIVQQDPLEQGARKALNFGHTVGHAVESCFFGKKETKLLHGESVAIGIIAESFISMRKEKLSGLELELIIDMVLHYFDLPFLAESDFSPIIKLLQQDKKNVKKQVRFTLLNGIGNYSIDNFVEEELILESVNYYNSLLE